MLGYELITSERGHGVFASFLGLCVAAECMHVVACECKVTSGLFGQ